MPLPRGQKPDPQEIHLLKRGANQQAKPTRRIRNRDGIPSNAILATPAAPETVPPFPPSLKEGGRGQQYWTIYWIHARSWLSDADFPMVVRLCEVWDTYANVMGTMAQEGYTVVSTSRRASYRGKSVPHPMLGHLKVLLPEMERLESMLGLNPVSRSRVRVQAEEKGSPLDQWQRARRQTQEATAATA